MLLCVFFKILPNLEGMHLKNYKFKYKKQGYQIFYSAVSITWRSQKSNLRCKYLTRAGVARVDSPCVIKTVIPRVSQSGGVCPCD